MSEIRIDREQMKRVEEHLSKCALRLQDSRAPESRALGVAAEAVLLDLSGAVARYDKLVELYGGEGRRPEYREPEGEMVGTPPVLAIVPKGA